MIRGQKVDIPELKKAYAKLEKIAETGKHSDGEKLYLRNALNSLGVCIKSKQNCGKVKR